MNDLSPAQTEQLKEIGAYLRQLRQEQSFSTEEIAAKTYIPLRLLKALEEGQLDLLPEPVFIQGFIRRYADVLKLDGAALAQTFPINVLPVEDETCIPEAPEAPSWFLQPPILIPILVAVAIASGLLYLLSRPHTTKPKLQTKNVPIPQQQKTPSQPKSSELNAPIQVKMSFDEQSWLRVIEDGKLKFEGTLTKGTQKTWTAKKQLTIRAGNAGAVMLSFNQQTPKPLGNLNEVNEVTFTPAQ